MNAGEWINCHRPELMLNGIRGGVSSRKLRLFAVACCRRFWTVLTDERSRLAIEIIERHIEGEANDSQLQEASDAAELAFQSQRLRVLTSIVGSHLANQAIKEPGGLFQLVDIQTARTAHDAADSDSACMAASATWSATASDLELQSACYSLIDSAIGTANQATAAASDTADEESAQAQLLREIFGNPFQTITLVPQSITPTVTTLSRQMYDSREFGCMPILADALEAAGCFEANILAHCRSAGPHVRGCWVIDLILGKP